MIQTLKTKKIVLSKMNRTHEQYSISKFFHCYQRLSVIFSQNAFDDLMAMFRSNKKEMPLYRSVTQTLFPFECALCEQKLNNYVNCMQQQPIFPSDP